MATENRKPLHKAQGGIERFFVEHGLSVFLIAIYCVFQAFAVVLSGNPMSRDFWLALFQGHADDTWGAIVIVLATKSLYEKGSAASK